MAVALQFPGRPAIACRRSLGVFAALLVVVTLAAVGRVGLLPPVPAAFGPAVRSVPGTAGLAAAIARLEARHHPSQVFSPTPGGFATHLASGVPVLVGANGSVRLDDPLKQIDLALTPVGVGRSGLAPLAAAGATASGRRLTERLGPLTTAFANTTKGLEQSFVVARRPAGSGATASVALRLSAGSSVHLIGTHAAELFEGRAAVASYAGLGATDATGADVPAHFAVVNGQLRIVLDDRTARYPVRIDPTWETDGALASGGYSISTSDNGSVVLIGEPWDDDPNEVVTNAGEVFLLMRNSSDEWVSTGFWAPSYDPSDPGELQTTNAFFGSSVAVSSDGEAGIVAMPGFEDGYAFVYSFSLSGGGQPVATWTAYLEAESSTNVYPGGFGASVAIYHDATGPTTEAFVGAPDSTSGGAVYAYLNPMLTTFPNGNYAPDELGTALYDSDTGVSGLGSSIGLSANHYVFAGAPDSSVAGRTDCGAVAEFSWNLWPNASTTALDYGVADATFGLEAGDKFGASVAASANAAVVAGGEPGATFGTSAVASGAVRILDFGPTEAAPIAARADRARTATSSRPRSAACDEVVIGPSTGQVAGEAYGTSVSVSDDGTTILVGAPFSGIELYANAPGPSSKTPYAYVDYSAGAGWTCTADSYTEQAFAGPDGSWYGASVALAGNLADGFVGAPYDDADSFTEGTSFLLLGPVVATGSPATIIGAPPAATEGKHFSYAFSVGGSPAPSVAVTSGTLPRGLSLSGATVSGTPSAAGSSPVTLRASNTNGSQSDSVTFVVHAAVPKLSKVSPAHGTTAGGSSVTLTGQWLTGATKVYFGSKPAKFTVTSGTTIVATAPAGSGAFAVTVTTPGGKSASSGAATFTYRSSDVRITTTSLAAAKRATTYRDQLAASHASSSPAWKLAGGKLPAGVRLSSSGLLSGKPTKAGTYSVTVEVSSGGTNDTATFSLSVAT